MSDSSGKKSSSRKTPIIAAIGAVATLAALGFYFRMESNSPSMDPPPESSSTKAVSNHSTGTSPQHKAVQPDLKVDTNGLSKSQVVIETEKGQIRFKFYPKDAPKTVNRIAQLVNQGFYNGLIFHRFVAKFVIQGGDPLGNGTGGSGQKLQPEFNSRKHLVGTVAMARAAAPDSADSQFYITLTPQPTLDGQYTIFGQVIEGMDVVRKIRPGDVMKRVYIAL